jgi:hypothetical protein
MAYLTMQRRRMLPASDFVFPERRPGHGSYPIPDEHHARLALQFSAGTADEEAVRRAVAARYPHLVS